MPTKAINKRTNCFMLKKLHLLSKLEIYNILPIMLQNTIFDSKDS